MPRNFDMSNEKALFLISLGCPKNRVDSEHMLGILKGEGYEPVTEIEKARCVVINTCGFLEEAAQEAIDVILDAASRKGEGGLEKLVVTGCFVQRYGYKLRKEMPEVDGWLGTGEFHRIGEVVNGSGREPAPMLIGRPDFPADHHLPKIQSTPFYTAYLRIAEGCANRCSYCLIPKLRGPFRSRAMEALLSEARDMADHGVKEINLVAQDTSRYGEDIFGESRIKDLLEGLSLIDGIQWLRLLYFYPDRLTESFLDFIDGNERIVPYLDLPFQHSHGAILKAMGRDPGDHTPRNVMNKIRNRNRRIHVRTSLIVGFPGETDEMFNDLCDFVEMAQFDNLGVFPFSPEKGTLAARLPDQVEGRIALKRRARLMELQADISKELNQQKVGQVLPVLVEGESSETELLLAGRTSTMAPDVDGRVLINEGTGIVGDIMPVLITEAHEYDLVGRILT
ncbi:MAG: 30S ribosomal protein S12 methylthiotransferase RimO [Deltaproteobacteria bacterium]|nr:30S ribosomal protein S12 methylthiotransferase RimO [Deltaproteobacteria bacterium]